MVLNYLLHYSSLSERIGPWVFPVLVAFAVALPFIFHFERRPIDLPQQVVFDQELPRAGTRHVLGDRRRSIGLLGEPSRIEDPRLAFLLARGERRARLEALETLYDRYRAMAYGIARRITADDVLAEDVVRTVSTRSTR